MYIRIFNSRNPKVTGLEFPFRYARIFKHIDDMRSHLQYIDDSYCKIKKNVLRSKSSSRCGKFGCWETEAKSNERSDVSEMKEVKSTTEQPRSLEKPPSQLNLYLKMHYRF